MLEGWKLEAGSWKLEAGGWRLGAGKFAAMKIYQDLWLNQKQELQVLILQIFIDLDRG